jgi:hypothetical protein
MALNGYSNSFYGWGGEDDDLFNRIRKHNLTIFRSPGMISRFYMFEHKQVLTPGIQLLLGKSRSQTQKCCPPKSQTLF